MKTFLEKIYNGQSLSQEEACFLMTAITAGNYPATQVAALLSALRMRPVSVDELKGFRAALLDLAVKVDGLATDVVDVCGTGGDNKNSFNISTCVSFLMAALGVKVAKHGNYALSSKCGSSNVLEALGVKLPTTAQEVGSMFKHAGITFLHAPLFHPAMKGVAPIRKELGVRTVFNLLGPLVNPAKPSAQLIGVYSQDLLETYRQVLLDQPVEFCIVHSLAGYDEVSLTSDVIVARRSSTQQLSPKDFGSELLRDSDLQGADDAVGAAQILEAILRGQGTAAQSAVVSANAGLLLSCINADLSLKQCVERAKNMLLSGAAFEVLQAVRGAK